MKRRPETSGGVLGGIDWSRWSVILCKPDCVRDGKVDAVLERIAAVVPVLGRRDVVVADWQVFVHYWDLLVDRDWYDLDTPTALREMYAGKRVTVALAHGPAGTDTPALVRSLLGHFDPSQAAPDSIRGALGTDSLTAARAAGRLVENLVHSSDDPAATCRDFGTWYGADQYRLLEPPPGALPGPRHDDVPQPRP